jgi:hypothetical protein
MVARGLIAVESHVLARTQPHLNFPITKTPGSRRV